MIKVTKARTVKVHYKLYREECLGDTVYHTSRNKIIGVRTIHADKNCSHLDNIQSIQMLPESAIYSYEKSCSDCTVDNPSYKTTV